LHDTSEYFEHPYFRARREDSSLNLERCREIFARIGTVLELASLRGERVLDIGCDTGSLLLAAAQSFGVVPFGLDVSSRAVQVSQARGLQVFHGTVAEAPHDFSHFRVVTAVDVLEHTTEPYVFLRQVYERTMPGGFLYLQTPNFDSIIYQLGRQVCNLTKGRPRASMERLFPAQHAQYFSRAGLAILAQNSGFDVAHVETRVLPARDIVASSLLRAGLAALQVIDTVRRREILLCTVLRKPV
jgi:2-polyprenyl-3-methyl-5-hydroxy-6-metoxy-1,4-benzoquinol methylase